MIDKNKKSEEMAMTQGETTPQAKASRRMRTWLIRTACLTPVAAGLVAVGAGSMAPVTAPAVAETTAKALPPVPANGTMGFVIENFWQPVIFEKNACPDGNVIRLREAYLTTLPAAEAARLKLEENKQEWDRRWQTYAFGPDGANVCTNPDMFDRPVQRTVKSPNAIGLDLDQGLNDTCAHEEFVSPTGERGIDNQEYRAMGCTPEWRGVDGVSADQKVGMQQFLNSGEWTQVILLKGVDSLQNDSNVEVIFANTPDRPVIGTGGKWLAGASFTVSDKLPRHRNVMKGRIVDGVLTTDPTDIKLTFTWGQGGARDLRGQRSKFDYRHARLRLAFQPDGTLTGLLGGYRPLQDVIISGMLGGAGTALVAGKDCASELKTLQVLADGLKDARTGKCEGISSTQQIAAIPAFVTDLPQYQTATRTAAK
jgi:hypothetical protein